MLTLQNIKEIYESEKELGFETRDFEQFLRENYVQTFDENGIFIGYKEQRV